MKFINYTHPKYGVMKVPIDPPILRSSAVVERVRPTDYIAGANSPLPYEITKPSSDWRSLIFLPDKQFYPTFDTFACTNFSACNSRKLQYKNQTGEEYNLSERRNAVKSGTQPNVGNYMTSDPDYVKNNGILLNKYWANDDGASSITEWFKPIPQDVENHAFKVNERYEWTGVDKTSLLYHLKQCPITVMITQGDTNHDICVVYVDSNGLWYLDSYPHNTADNFLAITTQVPKASLKIISKLMNSIFFVHIKGTTEYGLLTVSPVGKFYVPASTEEDLKIRAGSILPLTPDGKVDYSKAKDIDYSSIL